MRIDGAIIAGGHGRRMEGADKPLALLRGEPLIAHVAARLAPQVARLAVNANGDPGRFAFLGLPVFPDRPGDGAGPLVGVASALARAAAPDTDDEPAAFVATAPADTPFLPRDLVARLAAGARTGAGAGTEAGTGKTQPIVIAASGGRRHPLAALWPVAILPRIEAHLAAAGHLSMMAFLEAAGFVVVEFPFEDGAPDPFFNVNTPGELAVAEAFPLA